MNDDQMDALVNMLGQMMGELKAGQQILLEEAVRTRAEVGNLRRAVDFIHDLLMNGHQDLIRKRGDKT